MAEILEAAMVICFGVSWPMAIWKSITSKSAKGKSLPFMVCIAVGYVCGLASKIIAGRVNYVAIFYIINLCMVSLDVCLYFRNKKLDAQREAQA